MTQKSDTKESDLIEVNYSGKDRGKRTAKEQCNGKSKGKKNDKIKAKEQSPTNKKVLRVRKELTSLETAGHEPTKTKQ